MRESLRILAKLEAAALREMFPLYVSAITAALRNEDAETHWIQFRKMFERAYVLSNLVGRLEVRNSFGSRKYAAPDLMVSPWDKAIRIFMGKVPSTRSLVDRLMVTAKAKAFYVTGVESTEALERIRAKVTKTLSAEVPDASLRELQEQSAATLSLSRLETVLRTNTMTALNEGAMAEVADIGNSVAMLMLNEVHDRRTRGNPSGLYPDAGPHYQMDGFMESPSHPIWATIRPPNGFQCRGYISVIGWVKAQSMGLGNAEKRTLNQKAVDAHNGKRWHYILSGQYPDSGFGSGKASAVAA